MYGCQGHGNGDGVLEDLLPCLEGLMVVFIRCGNSSVMGLVVEERKTWFALLYV